MLLNTIVDIINKKYCNNNIGLSLTFCSFYRTKTISQKYDVLEKMILDNAFLGREKKEYLYVFSLHQKITFAINKIKHLYKIKKKYIKSDIDTDLSMEKLTTYKSQNLIELIENNTIYTFAVVDLLRILNASLLNSAYLRPKSQHPKNPYTNITFSIHNIYNIYLHIMLYTNYSIKSHILSYFENELNLRKYFEANLCLLKSASVKNYINHGETLVLFDYAIEMFEDYWIYTQIKIDMLLRNKQSIVNKVKHLLYYYLLLQHYSLDSELYTKYKFKLIMFLKEFKTKNPTFGRRIYTTINRHASVNALSTTYIAPSISPTSLPMSPTVDDNTLVSSSNNTLITSQFPRTLFGGLMQLDSSLNVNLQIPHPEEIIQSQTVINSIPSLEEWVHTQLDQPEINNIDTDDTDTNDTDTNDMDADDTDTNDIDITIEISSHSDKPNNVIGSSNDTK